MKEIPLSKGKIALVDDEDFERVNQFKWSMGTKYAMRRDYTVGKGVNVQMHRFIMGAKKGQMIDHINRNKLDNRKENLRFCTNSQNQMNAFKTKKNKTSKYKGVHKNNPKKKYKCEYHAAIRVNRKLIDLGHFDNEIDAAKAYNAAALQYFGEFASLNEF